MREQVLPAFPPHTHPLTLVSDPDEVLGDEAVCAALVAYGFRLIAEADPVARRVAVQQARPWSAESPLVVVTRQALNELAYDLWQQGHCVDLSLARLFPSLAYAVVRTLSNEQRRRLSTSIADQGLGSVVLGQQETIAYLLDTLFDIVPDRMRTPAQVIAWLNEYHSSSSVLPALLAHQLQEHLRRNAPFATWPLDQLLADAQAYRRFVQDSWMRFLHLGERRDEGYGLNTLAFDQDRGLQDLLPRLLRSGTLVPVEVGADLVLPEWTAPAIRRAAADTRRSQVNEQLDLIERELQAVDRTWEQWQTIAWRWAQLTGWRYTPTWTMLDTQIARLNAIQANLDILFVPWLQATYAQLATRRLPTPHHLFHIPHWLAHHCSHDTSFRPAVLILDGMALADWLQIRAVWQARHADWLIHEQLVLAQIPSLTAVSRQALISGLRPDQFANSLLHNRQEQQQWTAFWHARGLPTGAALYHQLDSSAAAKYPAGIESRNVRAVCLISRVIDEMVHGASQGAPEVQASLDVWLHHDDGQPRAHWLEGLIDHLCDLGYTVVITSDHGHVEAFGMGTPQEGVNVESRSKRARIYRNADIALHVQGTFAETICWHDDGLLPSGVHVLVPRGRLAFAHAGACVVSHGGLTIDEVVVPLITITRRD